MKRLEFDMNNGCEVMLCASPSELPGNELSRLIGTAEGRRSAFIITDSKTAELHLDVAIRLITCCGAKAIPIIIPSGESSKSLDCYADVCTSLLENGCGRNDLIVNLGGGMVGDLGGFVAATYMRGIRFINIPTTLVSMVDSSMGGKTGIDFNGKKNILGAFHFPAAVLICTEFLLTLPDREFRSGMGEIIKYAAIGGKELSDSIRTISSVCDIDEELVFRCCDIKRKYVCGDEYDFGSRRVLNLGHSFGHAFEAASGFSLSHGEAVGLGLLAVADFGSALGITEYDAAEQIKSLLWRFGMETDYLPYAKIAAEHLQHDKKLDSDMLNMVFIRRFGQPVLRNVPVSKAKEFLLNG